MFRWALSYLLSSQPPSQSVANPDMAEMDTNTHDSGDTSTQPCFFLEKLPPELRIRIYECLILSEHRLVPLSLRSKAALTQSLSKRAQRDDISHPIDIAPFLLNKQIYAEVTDIFYTFNKFTVHYDYVCECWKGKTLHLNEAQIKRFKIQGINFDEESYPRLWSRCKICDTQGFWLLKYLNRLPKLKAVTLAFADVESFAICMSTVTRKLRRLEKNALFETNEIGRVFITGMQAQIELRLPSLVRTWTPALAKASEPWMLEYDSEQEYASAYGRCVLSEADMSMYLALRDILYHAITAGSTTEELQPLMRKVVTPSGLHMERLDRREKADFTIALAGCLADIIAEDENVHMADRRDLVELSDQDASEKYGRSRASSALNLRPYSYLMRF